MNTLTIKRARAIAYALKVRYCASNAGDSRLVVWPRWLSYKLTDKLIKIGVMRRETGGPATYNHTDLFVLDFDKWPQ